MNHAGTKTITTDRLILRKYVSEDADAMYYNWASEDAVTRYLTWPTHANIQVTKAVLSDWISSYERPDFYNWGIELKSIGEVVGNIAIVQVREETSAAIVGWCLGTKWWGQGIMPEAAKAVASYLFDEVGFLRIAAYHDKNNPKSGHVMQKIGMSYEGTLRSAGKNNQGICDEVWYGILKQEYECRKKR